MTAARIDAAALNSTLRQLAEQPGERDLFDALQRVLDATEYLFEVDGAGLILAGDQGELQYVVARPGLSETLERIQIELGEGPCVDSYLRDEVVVCADLAGDDRYPRVAPQLVREGIGAVLGIPVHLSGLPVGGLDLYVRSPRPFERAEVDALTRYGTLVEAVLHAAVSASATGRLADQLTYALDHRVPIERAIGFLMARDRLDQTAAFDVLRHAARERRQRIGDIAAELLKTGVLPNELDRP